METFAQKLASTIAQSLNYDKEQEDVLVYGMIALTQIVVTIVLVVIIGLVFHVLTEALIITFSVSLLRKYSGGVHARSIELCTAISVIYCIVFALISKHLIAPYISNTFLLIISMIVFIASYLIIYKLAPVDTPNKPIVSEKKKQRMRKGSFITITIFLVFAIAFLLLGRNNIFYTGCLISLLFGIAWQINTLTKSGVVLTNWLNNLFQKKTLT